MMVWSFVNNGEDSLVLRNASMGYLNSSDFRFSEVRFRDQFHADLFLFSKVRVSLCKYLLSFGGAF